MVVDLLVRHSKMGLVVVVAMLAVVVQFPLGKCWWLVPDLHYWFQVDQHLQLLGLVAIWLQ
jgi:hypothetical protein